MKNIKKRFIDEKTGIEYIRCGNYFLPNLIDIANVKYSEFGKYGRMRLRYLKEYKKAEYFILWSEDKLREHLKYIDKTANEIFKNLIKLFAEKENITEELKENNQLEWISKMNNIKNRIEEIIYNELIYV